MSIEDSIESSQALATLFPAFPTSLAYAHNLHQDVPAHLHAKLKYLYASLVSLHNASLGTMHALSKALMQVFRDEQVCLPAFLQDRFCSFCSICLIPAVSCRVRIRPRSRKSKANRILGKEDKPIRNEMMVHCLQCKHVAKKLPGFLRTDGLQAKTPKKESLPTSSSSSKTDKVGNKKTATTPGQSQPSSASKANVNLGNKTNTTTAPAGGAKGFSFLDKLNQAIVTNRAAPAAAAAFSFKNPSTSNSNNSNARRLSAPITLGQMANDGDFIPLTKTAFSHVQQQKGLHLPGAGQKRPSTGLSLLELEQAKKKKKRQSLGASQ